ncbi:MAG: isoprenyl transferase [Candidatus Omnitrophica bacterium CG11_big_fil_rev_8_21_14_0_20_64_10]|nr:MAG: isoprenyl transferase [Candidatus Omnitrophica bacterium CG11_big_fil_rev_8_21_14_0_20_64_10]
MPVKSVSRKVQGALDRKRLPRHVAVIMDGNGRWAAARHLPRVMGHRAGIRSVRAVVEAAREWGIQVLTLYAFSRENWKRSAAEVSTLMRLLDEYLRRELDNMMRNGIRLGVIGEIQGLPEKVQAHLEEVMKATAGNRRLRLNLALNYGGRAEILRAVRLAIAEAQAGRLKPEELDEAAFSRLLDTGDLPDPDLLIRTSGESRVSNFLLWQISYAELYWAPVLWPDFGKEAFHQALEEFQKRERRFGGR